MARSLAPDHDEKRTQILSKAAEVFAEQGFDRAPMSQLADLCGISKATIYHYYESKEALLFDIIDNYLSALRDLILATNLMGKEPDEALSLLLRSYLRAYQGMDNEHHLQVVALSALPKDKQRALKVYQRDLVQHMAALLAQCAPKLAKDEEKCRAATMSVFGMINWFYMWQRDADEAARDSYAQTITKLTLGGIDAL